MIQLEAQETCVMTYANRTKNDAKGRHGPVAGLTFKKKYWLSGS